MYSICDPKGKPNGNLSKSLPAESYKKNKIKWKDVLMACENKRL